MAVADLAAYVEFALETFGPERLLFGSDWPVCLLAASYETWQGRPGPHGGPVDLRARGRLRWRAEAVYRLSVAPDRVG